MTSGHRPRLIADEVPLALTFDDVLLVPRRSDVRSRQDVSLRTPLTRRLTLEIPVVGANMDTVCEWEMALALGRLGGIGIIHRFLPVEQQATQIRKVKGEGVLVGAAVGTDHDALLRAAAVVKAGADAIKIGVGPGGVCTTRLVAGVGVPQLTAIADCASLVDGRGLAVPIIADGGIRSSGDIAKALAAGAQSVMIGSLFAGTKESPGDIEQSPHGLVKRVRGMASFEALRQRAERHDTDIDDEYFEQRAPEGVEGTVPYKGSVIQVVNKLMAGVRSSMSYLNSRTIHEFQANARFVRVTPAGQQESLAHATFTR